MLATNTQSDDCGNPFRIPKSTDCLDRGDRIKSWPLDDLKFEMLARGLKRPGHFAYGPRFARTDLLGEESAAMALIGVAVKESAAVLETVKRANGADCKAAKRSALICDPNGRYLLIIKV